MPLMLSNRYAKDIGGISIGQKIIHNKPQEGVVLTPSLGIEELRVLGGTTIRIAGLRAVLGIGWLEVANQF